MTTELTPAQAARLAAIEAADYAPESLRVRIAAALWAQQRTDWYRFGTRWDQSLRLADAALQVITEDARS